MIYRRFGRTELHMPLISTGGMRFQTSWKRDDAVKAETIANIEKIVAHALDLGINHFETAYGYGTSEQELGHVLPHFNRAKLLLQTKGPPTGKVKKIFYSIKTSLKALKVDYLDLFAVHGINNDALLEEALKKGALVEKALHLKKEGVIRFLGFSSHGPTSTIIKAIQTGVFDYVNLWYSYINQTNWPAIQEAQKQDMGVFIISPNDKGGRLYDPPEKLCRLCAPLSPMTFNDIFILSHPEIHTISCGAQRPEDLDKHVSAVARMDTLQDTVTEIRQRLDQTLESVIDKEWAHNYTQGLPDWSDTPGHINIPAILWLWNLVKAFDLTEYAKFRFNLMGNAEHWFPGAKPEVFATIDPHELRKALANSPYTDRIMDILKEAHEMFKSDKGKRLGSE